VITKESAESQIIRSSLVFGEIAVKKGFLTQEQLDEALVAQRSFIAILNEKPLKRIGDILFEKGWLTVEQIYNVQSEVFKKLS
jgi:hypothetical protein